MAKTIAKAGADVIVIGNLLEKEGFEAKPAAIVKAVKQGIRTYHGRAGPPSTTALLRGSSHPDITSNQTVLPRDRDQT